MKTEISFFPLIFLNAIDVLLVVTNNSGCLMFLIDSVDEKTLNPHDIVSCTES